MTEVGRMQAEPVLLDEQEAVAEAERVIGEGLSAFNAAVTGIDDRRALAVVVRGADGAVLGGVSGRTSLGMLFINVVHLPRELRGAGLGRRLLHLVEEEARRRGCRSGVLWTISFQAPGFYEKHGWRRFGEVACDPPGTSRVFMSKQF